MEGGGEEPTYITRVRGRGSPPTLCPSLSVYKGEERPCNLEAGWVGEAGPQVQNQRERGGGVVSLSISVTIREVGRYHAT